jgi:hypothetical protein
MHNGLVFEVYGIFVHKKTAPLWVGWGVQLLGCSSSFQTACGFMGSNSVGWVDKPKVSDGLWICWVCNPTYPTHHFFYAFHYNTNPKK